MEPRPDWRVLPCAMTHARHPHQRHHWIHVFEFVGSEHAWCPGFGPQHAAPLRASTGEAYASGRNSETSTGVNMKFKIFGRSPTLAVQAIGAVVMVAALFGVDWLTVEQAGLVAAVLAALVTGVNALLVRPVNPALFAGLIQAGAALTASYGFDVTVEQLAAIQFAVQSVVAFLLLNYVTPVADPAVGGGVSVKDVPGANVHAPEPKPSQ